MNEVMTWAEIEAAFDGEWVLIENPETTPVLEIVRGKVVFHGRDKSLVQKKMKELQLTRSAFLFVGEHPDDVAYLL
ncbi:MAG: hypothetical protein F4X65_08610 [Chloroflexi bacterium]|nr:hypothetical protein [Chloroflexota bacterium]